jgi:hypothetical protein
MPTEFLPRSGLGLDMGEKCTRALLDRHSRLEEHRTGGNAPALGLRENTYELIKFELGFGFLDFKNELI